MRVPAFLALSFILALGAVPARAHPAACVRLPVPTAPEASAQAQVLTPRAPLPVRTAPDAGALATGIVPPGTILLGFDECGAWINVVTNSGTEGWAWRSALDPARKEDWPQGLAEQLAAVRQMRADLLSATQRRP